MALLYDAELSPTKRRLLRDWLPRTSFYRGGDSDVDRLGAFRFDDPAGEVGIETHLVRDTRGVVYQVPWTYRSAPLPDGRSVGETEHSVLGHRFVYDATTDPVYVRQLLVTICSGGSEAEHYVHVDGGKPRKVAGTVRVRGSGAEGIEVPAVTTIDATDESDSRTHIGTAGITIVVHHLPTVVELAGPGLMGTWEGGGGVLATIC
ncbi:maltokinase N-terminal cap-like domain-containing protein [Rhodococcus sp. As11]|uniref:maltokinase N-terminal cap-like domain-containing protein n=1 Tax=Rhodococcus sp. As11 TaxID=3029189 RepID=UPI003B800DA2